MSDERTAEERPLLDLELPSGKAGCGPTRPPQAALRRADELLANLSANPELVGDTDVVAGWWIETHTLGCRDAADQTGDEAWETHYAIYEEHMADGCSAVFGHPDDGRFVTLTPTRR